jgi:hypothetical protein
MIVNWLVLLITITSSLLISGCETDCATAPQSQRELASERPSISPIDQYRIFDQNSSVYNGNLNPYIMHAEDFDLQAVLSLIHPANIIQSPRDLAELEMIINDPTSGINNVDLDQDGRVDYVGCVESNLNGRHAIDFVAYPSADPRNTQPIIIASLSIIRIVNPQRLIFEAGYAEYVYGYDEWFYYDVFYYDVFSPSWLFLTWWWNLRPLYHAIYYNDGPYYYWHQDHWYYRPPLVVTVVIIRERRTAYYDHQRLRSFRRSIRPHGHHIPSARRMAPEIRRRYGRPAHHYNQRPAPPPPPSVVRPAPPPHPTPRRNAPPPSPTPRNPRPAPPPNIHRPTPPAHSPGMPPRVTPRTPPPPRHISPPAPTPHRHRQPRVPTPPAREHRNPDR